MRVSSLLSNPKEKFAVETLGHLLDPALPLPSSGTVTDWDSQVRTLEKNRIATLSSYISTMNPQYFPAPIHAYLANQRRALEIYGDHCSIQVKEILQRMNRESIPVIVLKGWAAITWLYDGDHSLRVYDDIDLLFRPTDIDSVICILHNLNYAPVIEINPGFSRKYSNAQAFQKTSENDSETGSFSIGVHWGFTHYPVYDPYRIDIGQLFNRAHPILIAGQPALELSIEDQIVYLCAHVALHHYGQETLLQYYEIAASICRFNDQLNWATVCERANQWGYLGQVKRVLDTVYKLWSHVLPEDLLAILTKQKIRLRDRFIDTVVRFSKPNRFISSIVELFALPSFSGRIKFFSGHLFPRKEYVIQRYGAAPTEIKMAYWRRIKRAIVGLAGGNSGVRGN